MKLLSCVFNIHKRTVDTAVLVKSHISKVITVHTEQLNPSGAALCYDPFRELFTPLPGCVGVYRLQIG